jgi:DNA-binding CsgD family transcriptional regulator
MRDKRLGRTLAIGIAALAVLTTVSNLSMPVADRRPSVGMTLAVALALVAHSVVYWFGDRLRERFTVAGYLAVQAALVFLVGLSGTIVPVVLTLYVALTVESIIVAESQLGTMAITTGAIVLLGASAAIAWGVYRAATAGLLLAVVGVLAHAVAALVRRDAPGPPSVPARTVAEETASVRQTGTAAELHFDRPDLARLTAREREVLRALASGARTIEIAKQLDIAERTVKAHLANIYQKLGVDSRTAAVAVALQNDSTVDATAERSRVRERR